MKVKHSLLFLLLIWASMAKSQQRLLQLPDTNYTGSMELALDIDDYQKQTPDKSSSIITPNTIVSRQVNKNGRVTITAYVNRDYISIICKGITMDKWRDYEAYCSLMPAEKDSLYEHMITPIKLLFTEHDTAYLDYSQQLNQNKLKLYGSRMFFYVKNRSAKVVASMIIKFVFPKPELDFISLNDSLIKAFEARPGESMVYPTGYIIRYMKGIAKDGRFPPSLSLGAKENTLLFRFKSLTHDWSYCLEYQVNEEGWRTSSQNMFPFIILHDLKPGKYKLQVRYPNEKNNVLIYEFEINPAFTQTTSFKVLTGSVITACFLSLIFWGYSIRQKRKLKKEVAKRTQLQNQIAALQARLQPHFIFNALNSIQGLINKRYIEEANSYISKFGALLHEIIGKSDQTMHPLATEIKQIEYYLQLEQLRFKFQYKITVGESINTSEINIPTMLLQPYVENAIKHGIIEKKEAGMVELLMEKNNNNLVIAVKDNGKGYEPTLASSGRGNAMVAERIDALNKLLKDQQVVVEVRSGVNDGTAVVLNFTNWL